MSGHRRIAISTIIVMSSTFGSALLGFVREVINARFYGTHWELDTFLAAAAIPTVLFGIFNGALLSALVPVFSSYLSDGEDQRAWSLANTVFNLIFFALVGCAIFGWIFAPLYVPLIAHGFPKPQLDVTIRMTRWLMPSIIATSLGGVVSAMLNANHRFGSAAFGGIVVNVVTIVTVMLLNPHIGIYALTLGTTLGLFAQLLVQVPALLRLGRYRPEIDLRHPGLIKVWAILGPIIIGSAAGQIALCSDRFFASMLAPGSISSMNYAIRIVGVPLQIFAAAIATVIFPVLSRQFASGDSAGTAASMRSALDAMFFVTIPATGLLIILSRPIVATLFEGGAFDQRATDACAGLLPYAAAGLIAQASTIVLSRCCFAAHESRWSVYGSVAAVIVNIVASIILLPPLGARGLLAANAISQVVQAVVVFFPVLSLARSLSIHEILIEASRLFGATIAMMFVVHGLNAIFAETSAPAIARIAWLASECAVGAAIYLLACRLSGSRALLLLGQSIRPLAQLQEL